MNDEDIKEQNTRWYVMTHLKPELAEKMLQRELEGEFADSKTHVCPTFKYFIPSQFLRHRDPTDEPTGRTLQQQVHDLEFDRDVRESLHRYIFIQADSSRIASIVGAKWNVQGVLRLNYAKNKSGEVLTVDNKEMTLFMDVIKHRRRDCSVEVPIGEISKGDIVTLQMEPWNGCKAVITGVKIRRGRIRIAASMDVLGDIVSVRFNNLKEGDVVIENHVKRRLLKGRLLRNFEDEMMLILARDNDYERAKEMYNYRDVDFDRVDDYRRCRALMLICAHILKLHDDRELIIQEVMAWVRNPLQPVNETEAYISLALFVATHDPALREGVKRYLHNYPRYRGVVRPMFAKVKRLRVR